MKKNLLFFALSVIIVIILVSCTDGVQKMFEYENPVRIEYSKCTGCLECIEEFECPQGAIKKDPKTGYLTNYIDTEKCIQCMRCINTFKCPENAITTIVDQVRPANISDFTVTSDTLGTIVIRFTAPGDDGMEGLVYHYDLQLFDTAGNTVNYEFEFPILQPGGEAEEWVISNLEPDQTIEVNLQAFDEMELSSDKAIAEVVIMGLDIDDIPPAAINDLVAESGENEVTLTWTAPGDDGNEGMALGYRIRYNNNLITTENWDNASLYDLDLVPQNPGFTETVELNNLNIGEQFYFAIKAFDEEENLAPISNNDEAMITGDVTAPAAITDLTVSNVSINSIQLTWTAVGDNDMQGTASAYEIKYSTFIIDDDNWDEAITFGNEIIPQIAGSPENIMIDGLETSTQYFAAVKVVDEADNYSNISNIVNATTADAPDIIPPSPITDLTAEETETEITLSWTATGDDGIEGIAYEYKILMSNEEITEENWTEAEELANPPVPQVAGSLESYIIDNLEPGVNHYFAIKVYDDEANISDLSNVVEAAILLDQTAPASVIDLSATGTESEIILTWTAPGDDGNQGMAQYYIIKINTVEITDANWDQSDTVENPPTPQLAGSNESMILTDLDVGIEYFFALKTIDYTGNISDLSNSASASMIVDDIAPNPVTDLAVETGTPPGSYSMRITWTGTGDDGDVGTVDYYEIRYSQSPIDDSNWDNATLSGIMTDPNPAGNSEQYIVSGLERGIAYYFAVKPFDGADNSCSVSNSPVGKIVYAINAGPCNGCGRCVTHCDQDAITDHGSYASIDPELCIGCGECVMWCPRNAIQLTVVIP